MSNGLIAFLFALGSATWVGNWFYRRTGGNAMKSVGAGAVSGIIGFIILLSVLSLIPK